MFGWLNGLLNRFTGGLSAIWNSFINVLQVLYGNVNNSINSVIAYANAIAAALRGVINDFNSFVVNDYYQFAVSIVTKIDNLTNALTRDYNALLTLIHSIHGQDQQNITIVQDNLNNGLAALLQWVISHVFDPLFSDISGLLAWLARWGNWLVDILTHLEKLADLIMAFIWSGWLLLFQKYAKQIVLFIFHNWKSWIPSLLPIIEDIISAII